MIYFLYSVALSAGAGRSVHPTMYLKFVLRVCMYCLGIPLLPHNILKPNSTSRVIIWKLPTTQDSLESERDSQESLKR